MKPKRSSRAVLTCIRAALRVGSTLTPHVRDGLRALEAAHHECLDEAVRPSFDDSLNLDAALKKGRERQNRWDYLLGHEPTGKIVAVEPHSAANREIDAVISKRLAAKAQLDGHLREGAFVAKWLWVASGKVHLAPMEKAAFRLAQNGIEFVGRKVTGKHLA